MEEYLPKHNSPFFHKLAYFLFCGAIVLIVVSMLITSIFPLRQSLEEGGVLANEPGDPTVFDSNEEFETAIALLNTEWGKNPIDLKVKKAFMGAPGMPESDFIGLSDYLKKKGDQTYTESLNNFCEGRPRYTEEVTGPKLEILTENLSAFPVNLSISGDYHHIVRLSYKAGSATNEDSEDNSNEDGNDENGEDEGGVREILMNIPRKIISFFTGQKAFAQEDEFTGTFLSTNENIVFSSNAITFKKNEDKEVEVEVTLKDNTISVGTTNISLTFDTGETMIFEARDYPKIWRDGYATMLLMGDPADPKSKGFGATEESFQQFYHNQILAPTFLEFMTPELHELIGEQHVFSPTENQYLQNIFNGVSQKVSQCKRELKAAKTKMDETQSNRMNTFNLSVAKSTAQSTLSTTSQSNNCNQMHDQMVGLTVSVPLGLINCVLRMEGVVGSVFRCIVSVTLKALNNKLQMNEQIPIKCDYTDNIPIIIPNFKEQIKQIKDSMDVKKLYFLPRSQQEDFLKNQLPQLAVQYIEFPGDESSKFFSKLLMVAVMKQIIVPKVLLPLLDNLNNVPITDERNNVSVGTQIEASEGDIDSYSDNLQTEVNAAAEEELERIRKEAIERQLKAIKEDQFLQIRDAMVEDFAVPTKEIRSIIGMNARSLAGVKLFIANNSGIKKDLAQLVKDYEFPKGLIGSILSPKMLVKLLGPKPDDEEDEEGLDGARIPVHKVQKAMDDFYLVKTFLTPSFSKDTVELQPGEKEKVEIRIDARVRRLPATFTITNSDPDIVAISPTSVTFNTNNWRNPQVIELTALTPPAGSPDDSADIQLEINPANIYLPDFEFNVIDGQTLNFKLLGEGENGNEDEEDDNGLDGPREILKNIFDHIRNIWKVTKAFAEDIIYQITFPQKDIGGIPTNLNTNDRQVLIDMTNLIEQTPVPDTQPRYQKENESQLMYKMPFNLEDMAYWPEEITGKIIYDLVRIPKADQSLAQKQQIDAVINYGARFDPPIIQEPLPKDYRP